MKRSPLKRGTKGLAKRNAQRIAKKAAAYRTVIASPFHKLLRYQAWERSNGLCECDQCVGLRNANSWAMGSPWDIERAFTPPEVWFTNTGKAPHLRFRSKDGELHHESYRLFGDENPDELRLVRWVWKECHQRIESEHGTRRRFLFGGPHVG